MVCWGGKVVSQPHNRKIGKMEPQCFVLVKLHDGRQEKIIVEPTTLMSSVLQQACTTLKLDADGFEIVQKTVDVGGGIVSQIVDLSSEFRKTGIANKEMLELTAVDQATKSVADQLKTLDQAESGDTDEQNLDEVGELSIWQKLTSLNKNTYHAINALGLLLVIIGIAMTAGGGAPQASNSNPGKTRTLRLCLDSHPCLFASSVVVRLGRRLHRRC